MMNIMLRTTEEQANLSEMHIPLAMFLKSYNKNIPLGFPRASLAILRKFRETHQMLFKHGSLWSIALHRKKVIDWLSSYRAD